MRDRRHHGQDAAVDLVVHVNLTAERKTKSMTLYQQKFPSLGLISDGSVSILPSVTFRSVDIRFTTMIDQSDTREWMREKVFPRCVEEPACDH